MEKTKTNILIPFCGFYESIASQKAEEIAFRNFVNEKDIKDNAEGRMDIPDDMTEAEQTEFWDVFYPKVIKDIREDIAKDYMYHLGKELGLEFTFESISSPKFYNFTTDRLFVDVDTNELIHFYNRVDKAILADMIKERHTSGPGFDSYYENDIAHESWSDPEKFDHNQWETVVDAYIKQNEIEVDDLYYI